MIQFRVVLAIVLAKLALFDRCFVDARRLQRAALMNINHRALRQIAVRGDVEMFMGPILSPLMRVRVPGTQGSAVVRRHILNFLTDRTASWSVEKDQFVSWTPYGPRLFSNIVATLDPRAPRRLVLACHYDSKFFEHGTFVGATDSAVPCAMLLDLARIFDVALSHRRIMRNVTLQLLFFDGEEAFKKWSATDSLYGSRHLAAKMHARAHPDPAQQHLKEIDSIETFVLLDLIGAAQPVFFDHFHATSYLYRELQNAERLLDASGLLSGGRRLPASYFPGTASGSMLVEDDHLPFLRRGVPVLHLIATPFPTVWHTVQDNKAHLSVQAIDNLNRILRVFVARYLHLRL